MEGEDVVGVAADDVPGEVITFNVDDLFERVKERFLDHDLEFARGLLACGSERQVVTVINLDVRGPTDAGPVSEVGIVPGVVVIVEAELLLV